jgi:uncharacterized protein YlaI
MIKVLKKGTRKQIKCDNCGALLQYEEEDIITKHVIEDLRLNAYIKYIVCPECRKRIHMEATR